MNKVKQDIQSLEEKYKNTDKRVWRLGEYKAFIHVNRDRLPLTDVHVTRLTEDGRLVCITCLPVTGRVLCQGCGEFKDVTEFRRVHNQLLGVSRMRICPECERNHIPVRINPITFRRKMMENKDESREGLEYHEDVPGLDGLYNIDLLIQDGVISREGDEYRLSVRWALSIVSETFISDPVVREIREKILSGDFCFHNKLKD